MWKSANSKGHHAVSLWERRKREERRHRSCSLLLETTPGTRFARIFAGELTSNWISCNRNLILFELRVLREFNLRFWSVGRISIPSLPRLSESVIIITINLFFGLKIIIQLKTQIWHSVISIQCFLVQGLGPTHCTPQRPLFLFPQYAKLVNKFDFLSTARDRRLKGVKKLPLDNGCIRQDRYFPGQKAVTYFLAGSKSTQRSRHAS